MANVLEVLRLTRRTALSALFFASGLTKLYAANEPSPAPIRQRSRDLLKRVVRWGCQYQKVDIDAIASSTLDMIVVDPSINDDLLLFIDREQCKVLQKKADGGRRIVLAYISVGEADTKRWYWPSKWRQQAPEWLGAQNPLWPGSYSVKYWDAGWRSLVFEGQDSILSRILQSGFDGVVLDRVDGYQDWRDTRASASEDMVDLVVSLAATARSHDPNFIVVIQNAEEILDRDRLVDVIDGHNKESLLTGLKSKNSINSAEDIEWSLGHLRRVQQKGVGTFATEYLSDQSMREDVRKRLLDLGFIPFFADRALDLLPDRDARS